MKDKDFIPRRKAQNDNRAPGEVHNTPPVSLIGPKIKGIRLSADDKIKQAIRNLRKSDQDEFDTFEEADDFDVDDDIPDPTSGYEVSEMDPDTDFAPQPELDSEKQKAEEKEKSAPKEAPPEEGADENKTSD